jgi:Domain of unknown function (DUF4142)
MRTTIRRAQLLCGGTVVMSLLGFGLPGLAAAQGQSPGTRTNPPEPDRFVRFALSSAALQERVSELAASRDTRPEVRAFARDMERFRNQQIARLRTLAQGCGQRMPEQQDFEHRVLLENLLQFMEWGTGLHPRSAASRKQRKLFRPRMAHPENERDALPSPRTLGIPAPGSLRPSYEARHPRTPRHWTQLEHPPRPDPTI